jgi:hypothetical protein
MKPYNRAIPIKQQAAPMATVIAVTDAIKSLADAEARLNLRRNDQPNFLMNGSRLCRP